MKHFKLILAALVAFVMFAGKAHAQTAAAAPAVNATAFAGKWDVLCKGLPNGDTHMMFNLTLTDGKLGGTLQDPQTKTDIPLTKIETDDKGIVIYFTAQGYDVSMNLAKKDDDDHVTGSLMGMFECNGQRVKQQ